MKLKTYFDQKVPGRYSRQGLSKATGIHIKMLRKLEKGNYTCINPDSVVKIAEHTNNQVTIVDWVHENKGDK